MALLSEFQRDVLHANQRGCEFHNSDAEFCYSHHPLGIDCKQSYLMEIALIEAGKLKITFPFNQTEEVPEDPSWIEEPWQGNSW